MEELIEGRCKETVSDNERWPSFHQCYRKVWKDGYCKQHHPDTVSARAAERDAAYEEKRKLQPWYKLQLAEERIAELEAEIERLRYWHP